MMHKTPELSEIFSSDYAAAESPRSNRAAIDFLDAVWEVLPRDSARWTLRPLAIIPILADGSPDLAHRISHASMRIAEDVVELDLLTSGDHSSDMMALLSRETNFFLALFPAENGGVACAGLDVLSLNPHAENRFKAKARIGGLGEHLLRPESLIPVLDRQNLMFRTQFPDSTLRQWAKVGAITLSNVDQLHVCPKCHGLPTFRRGCRQCGSARVSTDRLIHHFACAHVGLVRDFEVEEILICPKCRTRQLVAGTDFEYLAGPYGCQECNWTDVELERVATCLQCRFRFPEHQSFELEVRSYHAERLDLLALRKIS